VLLLLLLLLLLLQMPFCPLNVLKAVSTAAGRVEGAGRGGGALGEGEDGGRGGTL
jgi:hypothetical protein